MYFRIGLWIKDHADRMRILEALQANGYDCDIENHTEYMPPRVYVTVKLKDYEVEEGV